MTYHLASQMVLWIGIAVLVLGLFGDRARKSYLRIRRGVRLRRCPKCWYDLSRTQGMTCNECGYTAKRERKFHKSRKGWKLVWLAIVIFIASHALNVTPAVKDRGWPAAVPTTALIVSLPYLKPDFACYPFDLRYKTAIRYPMTWREKLYADFLTYRSDESDLGTLRQLLLERICTWQAPFPVHDVDPWPTNRDMVLATTRWAGQFVPKWHTWCDGRPDAPISQIQLSSRAVWPVGSKIYAEVSLSGERLCDERIVGLPTTHRAAKWKHIEHLDPYCRTGLPENPWDDELVEIGRAVNDDQMLEFEFVVQGMAYGESYSIRRWYDRNRTHLNYSFATVTSFSDLVTPIKSARLDTLLKDRLHPTLHHDYLYQIDGLPYSLRLEERNGLTSILLRMEETTIAFRAEVLVEGKVVATCDAWYALGTFDWGHAAIPFGTFIPLTVLDESALDQLASTDVAEVRLVGNGEMALRNFEAKQFWNGELVLPLQIDTSCD